MKQLSLTRSKNIPLLAAVAFTVILALFEILFLPFQPNDFVEPFSPALSLLFSAVSYLLVIPLFWVSFSGGPLTRVAAYLLYAAAIMTEYGYSFAMGRYSILQDYVLGFQGIDLQLILNAILAYLVRHWTTFFALAAYALLLWLTRADRRRNLGHFVLAILPVALFYAALAPYSRGTFQTLSYSAGFRSLVFAGVRAANSYHGPRDAVTYTAAEKPSNNIVLIVDESVRGDRLSLNGYKRDTTPYLVELEKQGRLYNWGIACSGATSSLPSNLLLFTGIYQLPDVEQNILKKPSILQYARAAGYRTVYIDVQMDTPWLLGKYDLAYLDELDVASKFTRGIPESEYDFAAARYLHDMLSRSTGNFIWVNKQGLHFPYPDVVPPGKNIWQPAETNEIYAPDRVVEIQNSYDNGLAYNLDSFFKLLLGPDGLKDTVIVYTSDHGQTLSEHGETWPHSGPTRNEAAVPLFLVSDRPLQVDTRYPASHANLFATLLDLMQVPADQWAYPYTVSLLRAGAGTPVDRTYIFGTLDSRLGSRIYPFDLPK